MAAGRCWSCLSARAGSLQLHGRLSGDSRQAHEHDGSGSGLSLRALRLLPTARPTPYYSIFTVSIAKSIRSPLRTSKICDAPPSSVRSESNCSLFILTTGRERKERRRTCACVVSATNPNRFEASRRGFTSRGSQHGTDWHARTVLHARVKQKAPWRGVGRWGGSLGVPPLISNAHLKVQLTVMRRLPMASNMPLCRHMPTKSSLVAVMRSVVSAHLIGRGTDLPASGTAL